MTEQGSEYRLPYDLKEAEQQFLISTKTYLSNSELNNNYLSINLKFDGLRLNPIINRFSDGLLQQNYKTNLLWADAGGAALAKRDMPDKLNNIFSYKEYLLNSDEIKNDLLIAVSPQPYDIDQFEEVCSMHSSSIIMINGKLEDAIVGIGSVGRERRKRFNKLWYQIFYLEPLSRGALMKSYPNDWLLFSYTNKGYCFNKSFKDRPDDESILLSL